MAARETGKDDGCCGASRFAVDAGETATPTRWTRHTIHRAFERVCKLWVTRAGEFYRIGRRDIVDVNEHTNLGMSRQLVLRCLALSAAGGLVWFSGCGLSRAAQSTAAARGGGSAPLRNRRDSRRSRGAKPTAHCSAISRRPSRLDTSSTSPTRASVRSTPSMTSANFFVSQMRTVVPSANPTHLRDALKGFPSNWTSRPTTPKASAGDAS
jgi:hypothetical protein